MQADNKLQLLLDSIYEFQNIKYLQKIQVDGSESMQEIIHINGTLGVIDHLWIRKEM